MHCLSWYCDCIVNVHMLSPSNTTMSLFRCDCDDSASDLPRTESRGLRCDSFIVSPQLPRSLAAGTLALPSRASLSPAAGNWVARACCKTTSDDCNAGAVCSSPTAIVAASFEVRLGESDALFGGAEAGRCVVRHRLELVPIPPLLLPAHITCNPRKSALCTSGQTSVS